MTLEAGVLKIIAAGEQNANSRHHSELPLVTGGKWPDSNYWACFQFRTQKKFFNTYTEHPAVSASLGRQLPIRVHKDPPNTHTCIHTCAHTHTHTWVHRYVWPRMYRNSYYASAFRSLASSNHGSWIPCYGKFRVHDLFHQRKAKELTLSTRGSCPQCLVDFLLRSSKGSLLTTIAVSRLQHACSVTRLPIGTLGGQHMQRYNGCLKLMRILHER